MAFKIGPKLTNDDVKKKNTSDGNCSHFHFSLLLFYELFNVHIQIAALQWLHNWTKNYLNFFIPMSVAVRLATNYEEISEQGTATLFLRKHISYITIDKLLIVMEF